MKDIDEWLSGERDYQTGVTLFSRYSKNKTLIRTFQNGSAKFHKCKLEYELGKLNKSTREPTPTSNRTITIESKKKKKDEAIPSVITTVKREISSLYHQIDMIHSELYECGISNDEKTIAKRKRLLDKRKPLCIRADILYRMKEEYFRKTGDEQKKQLESIRNAIQYDVDRQYSITKDENSNSEISKMSDFNLLKRKQALRSSITKTQNMLEYQSIVKGSSPTPLPEGLKRDKYIKKLNNLKSEYNLVDKEIKKRMK